jgi:hypothetical protein
MFTLHFHAACLSMLNVYTAYPRLCCMPMHHVYASFPCFMPMSHVYAGCQHLMPKSPLHVHAACPIVSVACPCCMPMSMAHDVSMVHCISFAACPCCIPLILKSGCPCWSVLLVSAADPCCMSFLLVHDACLCCI